MAKKKPKFEVIGNDAEECKVFAGNHFSPHHLNTFIPKTYPQRQFFDSYQENIPVIMQVGSAGTGKTACALHAALTDVFSKGTVYERVIIIRSSVQAREIGFLPGGVDDPDGKNAVYEAPYQALCDELMVFKSRNYENLKAKHVIEFHNSSFLRGKTFDNAVVIVDEFQCMNYHEISTAITRLGVNSRIVFCGDFKQNDLHKKGDVSGYHQFMKVAQKMKSSTVDVVTYRPEDIVRGGICKEFLLAEEEV